MAVEEDPEECGGGGNKGGSSKQSERVGKQYSGSDRDDKGTTLSEWARGELEREREKERLRWGNEQSRDREERGAGKPRDRKRVGSKQGTGTDSEEEPDSDAERGEVTMTLTGKWRPDQPSRHYYLRKRQGKAYEQPVRDRKGKTGKGVELEEGEKTEEESEEELEEGQDEGKGKQPGLWVPFSEWGPKISIDHLLWVICRA